MRETSATIGNQKIKVVADKYDCANLLAVITMMMILMMMVTMMMIVMTMMMMMMMIMTIVAISHGSFL